MMQPSVIDVGNEHFISEYSFGNNVTSYLKLCTNRIIHLYLKVLFPHTQLIFIISYTLLEGGVQPAIHLLSLSHEA